MDSASTALPRAWLAHLKGEKVPRYLVIPDSRRDDVRMLLSLSPDQLRSIKETLHSRETLKAKELSYQRVAQNANISYKEALSVLTALTNLIGQRKRYSLSDEQLLADLKAGWSDVIKKYEHDNEQALIELLSVSDEGYFVEKAEDLRTSFIPHMISVRSICDMRPVFDQNREEIEGALLVVLLGITTHNTNHENETFVVQLTRSDLNDLRNCLDETEKKLKVMEKMFEENLELF
jgi:hypothetical protein